MRLWPRKSAEASHATSPQPNSKRKCTTDNGETPASKQFQTLVTSPKLMKSKRSENSASSRSKNKTNNNNNNSSNSDLRGRGRSRTRGSAVSFPVATAPSADVNDGGTGSCDAKQHVVGRVESLKQLLMPSSTNQKAGVNGQAANQHAGHHEGSANEGSSAQCNCRHFMPPFPQAIPIHR